jgi:hypothetical protein
VLRGWTGTSRYLSERKQRDMLVRAGVGERVIYEVDQWPAFVRALRPGDRATVADLRIFGSRKALVAAVEEVEARKAKLVVVETGTEIDAPTLREVDKTLTRWRGEAVMKDPGRASRMGERGAAARKKKLAESRMAEEDAKAIWNDIVRYPLRADAVQAMRGWSYTTAWRRFGGRPDPGAPKRKR